MTETPSIVGTRVALGGWQPGPSGVAFDAGGITDAVLRIRDQVHLIGSPDGSRVGVSFEGRLTRCARARLLLLGSLPPVHPEWLGGRDFPAAHHVRFPYIVGEMAHGIATARMVVAAASAGMLGFFGAGGLELDEIEAAIAAIKTELGAGPAAPSWGGNLIHMPHDLAHEDRVVDLYLRHQVRRVSASAFMQVTPSIVRYACAGLALGAGGEIIRRNHLFAKVSRIEVARALMSPAATAITSELVARGQLTRLEARLAEHVPLAEDVTAEADSGGHTDNRPLGTLLPSMLALRDELRARFGYARPIRVGAAGGIGTPAAAASAFALGAAYVLTGSINQCTVESGMSVLGKEMLAAAAPTDVVMAPSPDMFELGVKVQVLKRGTLFSARARQLYDLYAAHASLDELPAGARARLEREVFRTSLASAWEQTARYWQRRSPAELDRAARDPKHHMALLFRSYVGQASLWAIAGSEDRRADYQLWCGPAMGAFNQWVRGSFLEPLSQRTVVQLALNLLEGAATITRAHHLRSVGLAVPAQAFSFAPRPLRLAATPGAHRAAS